MESLAMPNPTRCAISHLCGFLRERSLFLADSANYTDSLKFPSNDTGVILKAVGACGDANLTIVDADCNKVGWVYLIMWPAVAKDESVADWGDNDLMKQWWNSFEAIA
jgi:hypothetical protein